MLAAEQLHALATRADERGLKIAYEALAWGRHVSEYDHAWRIVEAADHPALGTCLDSFHILSRGTDLAAIDTIPGESIFFLQLADAPHLTMDVLQWSRHYRCFPGQGALDVAGLVERVLAAGYAGPLSLEVFNDVFRQADPGRTAIDAMRSLLVLEDRLPPPAPLDGFAFVEIGVDAGSATETEALLRAMGFRTPARIAASRCSCGSTATSASCSTTAPATTTRRSSRSPSPAAIRTPAPPARRRCSRRVLERRRGAGEADFAAVAAPDGTSVFFCGERLARRLPGHRRAERRPRCRSTASTTSRSRSRSRPSTRPGCSTAPCSTCSRARARSSRRPTGWSAAARSRAATAACASCSTSPRWRGRAQAELQHVAFACSRRARHRARDARPRRAAAGRARTTTTTTWRRGWSSSPALLDELRELGVLYDRSGGRRAPALLHGPDRRARVLRGARAARRLRRLRRRQLTRSGWPRSARSPHLSR